jgi:hypothetical protein
MYGTKESQTFKPTHIIPSQLKRGMRIEGSEHPSFTEKQVETVVTDHIRKHPFTYRS